MSQNGFERAGQEAESTDSDPVPEVVDWLIGVLIGLAGLLLLFAGSVLTTAVNREELAEAIEEDGAPTVGTTELTRPEAVNLGDTVVSWVGIGMLVAGAGLGLFAIAYVILRRRDNRRDQRGETISSAYANAVRGSAVTVVFSFIGVSAVLGGGLGGYLEGSDSDQTVSVGAAAGFLPAIPALVIALFTLAGVAVGLNDIDQTEALVVVSGSLVFATVIYAVLNAALGALGGYIGGRLAE